MKSTNRGRFAWPLAIAISLLIGAVAFIYRDHIPGIQALAQETTDKGKILYYKDPMGGPETSPVPKKDSMGMDFIPVYEETAPKPQSEIAPPTTDKGKIAYYRNPMGLPDISMEPKKDSMGMDYIPVYENDAAGNDNAVEISLDKVQKLGVMSEPAQMRRLVRAIHAVGSVEIDESRQVIVTSKFEGWIEKLKVTKTGDQVSRGDGMLEIFSPTLRIAESQYLSTLKSSPELAKTAKDQLRNKGMTDEQISALEGQTTPPRTMTISAPASGQVIEKQAVLGMRVEAGDPLYRLVDLSHVWVVANVNEQDIGAIRQGQPVDIIFDAFPGKPFTGTVSLVYPMVAMATRTAQVRIELDNEDFLLRPGMFANVAISADMQQVAVLAVPESAILDDGREQTVLIDRGGGKFEPRAVSLGSRADGYAAVEEGLEPGDKVVVSANFLIDAESNLQAALRAFTRKHAAGSEATQ